MPVTGYKASSLVRGKVARFTLTDLCGMPQITNSMYVTDGVIEVNSTKNEDEGDEIKIRRMNGVVGTYEPGIRSMLNYTVEAHLERVDPGVISMLTGDALILDAAGTNGVGFTERAGQLLTKAFALEVWTDTSGGSACVGGTKLYGYMLYPCLQQAYVTIDNITDGHISATIHATSYGGPSWGKGPYGTGSDGSSITGPVAASGGGPARLAAAVAADEHRHFELTTIAPPASQSAAGPQSITLPTVY